jgi:hypothetical protein
MVKRRVADPGQLDQIEPRQGDVLAQDRILSLLGKLDVPGAHLLAGVAPEHPIAEGRRQLGLDGSRVLDRQVRDAGAAVQHPRFRKGMGGASVEAPAAGPASIRVKGRVHGEIQIGQHRRQEHIGSMFRVY